MTLKNRRTITLELRAVPSRPPTILHIEHALLMRRGGTAFTLV